MDPQQLLATAGRAVALYILMLVVIRLLGKRTVGNFTAFDLLVALMLGEVVDEIIYGDVAFIAGTVAILVIAGAKYVTGWLSFKSAAANRLLEGQPTVLVEHGRIDDRARRREMMHEHEILAALRIHGIDDIRDVKRATLEVDGEVSVIREAWAVPLQKGDLVPGPRRQAAELAAAKAPAGPPSDAQRTDGPECLGGRVSRDR